MAPCKCARAPRCRSTGQPLQPDRVALVGQLKYVSTSLFDHVACPWTAHPRHALLPYTVMALTPRCAARAGRQSQLDRPAARPRICTAKA